MNMIKNLSKNVVKKYPDFHLREDLNFVDDGSHFRGFDYKGLPITTLRTEDTTYCDIRVDYLRGNEFTWTEWFEAGGYELTNEFNGVSEIDLDKLIENCEKCLALVDELNEKARTEELDMSNVIHRLVDEQQMLANFIEYAKKNLNWWNLSKYDIQDAAHYVKSLMEKEEEIRTLKIDEFSRKTKKDMIISLEKYGYVKVRNDDYYIEWLQKLIEKSM